MFGQKYITVYRSLTGAQISDPKIDLYEGVPDSVLRSTGILTVNKTHSNLKPLEQYAYSLTNPGFRKSLVYQSSSAKMKLRLELLGKNTSANLLLLLPGCH